MTNLINGNGQLGEELKKHISDVLSVDIYHTWDFLDKSKEKQAYCYKKFVNFVDNNVRKRIVFISTYTTNWTPYLKYKLKAELYLLENLEYAKIYRLPNLIGKGVCDGFKKGISKPDINGSMEIISPRQAAIEIWKDLMSMDWNTKIVRIRGTVTTPQLVYDLIRFGND